MGVEKEKENRRLFFRFNMVYIIKVWFLNFISEHFE